MRFLRSRRLQATEWSLCPGDIILFDGSDKSDVAHLLTHFLSNAIQIVSRSMFTHSVMLFDYSIPVNGKPQTELHIIESSIHNGVNGVQLNPLSARLAGYEYAVACHLSDRVRSYLDFGAMWTYAGARLNHDHYNVAELLAYLARHIPIVHEIPQLYQSDSDSSVCSEFVGQVLQAGGIPGLRPACMAPRQLAELHIYSGYTQLAGEPRIIPRFNSI